MHIFFYLCKTPVGFNEIKIKNVQKETWEKEGLQRHCIDKFKARSKTMITNETTKVSRNFRNWDKTEKTKM